MNKPYFAQKKNELKDYSLKWSKEAINCYNRHCICEGCVMSQILEHKCEMKHTVLEIFKLRGAPQEKILPTKEEISSYLDKGLFLKEIAKIYNISESKMYGISKDYNIDGMKIKEDTKKKRRQK